MAQARRRLILFSRYPEPGRTKTRLIPVLGAEGAAELHCALMERLIGAIADIKDAELEIRFAGDDEAAMRRWIEPLTEGAGLPTPIFVAQGHGDLGERMLEGFSDASQAGIERALLFGADIPALDAEVLMRAFEALDHAEVVLGPARDGGYYLVGAKAPHPALFADMPWSTAEVCALTQARAAAAGLRVALVDELADVDERADLAQLATIEGLERFAR